MKMQVRRLSEVPDEPTSGGIFTGEVSIKRVYGRETGADHLNVSLVFFPAGVRNTWHVHASDQCLWIMSGKGKVADRSNEYEAEPGMAFFIPAGESHWHGAIEGSSFSHISIIGGTAPTKPDKNTCACTRTSVFSRAIACGLIVP
jgi:quercetin dioxygenase-like cupin family protein